MAPLSDPVIEYYYSVRSSFTYLGSARIGALARRFGRRLVHRPILLAVTVPASGALPFVERPPHRNAYARRDLLRWASHLGLPIHPDPVHHLGPQELPAGVVMEAQRIVEGGGAGDLNGLSHAILEALWREDLDIADEEVIGALCEAAGFDADALIAGARSPRAALELERNNREAIVRGVMGAPTYFVDGENFYGQDRLDFVERALARAAGPHGG